MEYERLYERYEREKKGRKTIKARQLWFKILESQIETGTPYLLYKDQANKKSNQQNNKRKYKESINNTKNIQIIIVVHQQMQ